MSERVILAYSGGLDTSVAISWIGKETGKEVVAVAIDLGQGGEDMEVVRQRALDCGAVEAVVIRSVTGRSDGPKRHHAFNRVITETEMLRSDLARGGSIDLEGATPVRQVCMDFAFEDFMLTRVVRCL